MKIRPLHDRIVVRRTEEEQNFYFLLEIYHPNTT